MAIGEIRDKLKNIVIHCGGNNREATQMFLEDKNKFNEIAKEWTQKYATSNNITFEEDKISKIKEQVQKKRWDKEYKNEIKVIYKNQITMMTI